MRVAIAGKGGSGKTTIAGTLARVLAKRGRRVLAVDADSNPNLATVLGVPPKRANEIVGLPRSLVQRQSQPDGTTKVTFTGDADAVLREYGVTAPDGIQLVVMGRVSHGGAG